MLGRVHHPGPEEADGVTTRMVQTQGRSRLIYDPGKQPINPTAAPLPFIAPWRQKKGHWKRS